jgi:hypothetical protein
MKTVTRLLMVTAAVAGSISTAYAQVTLPSTGNSELMFFVNDLSTHSTYTAELTQTINGTGGYFTSADAATGAPGTLTTVFGDGSFNYSFSSDSALTGFITSALAAGNTLQWGLMSGAYSGVTTSAREAVGNTLFLVTGKAPGVQNTLESGLIGGAPTAYNTDIGTFNAQTLDAFSGTTNGVFGTSLSANGTNLNVEGAGYAQTGLTLDGTAFDVYGLSSNGATAGKAQAFLLGTASFNSATDLLSFTGETQSTVPLPAAAWLFGSGLLGLLGIGRRREIPAAAAA